MKRKLIFVGGKGGVGKSAISRAIARVLAGEKNRDVYWACFEDVTRPKGVERPKGYSNLREVNCESNSAFEEYVRQKIKIPGLARFFVNNKLIQYLAKAAPGLNDLLLLGKVWSERKHNSTVIVDLPSTGYGLAMFQSTQNFAKLFKGGPIHNDAQSMLETFGDERETGHIVVSLPEEMPLRESLELESHLAKLFPKNAPCFIVNKKFPCSKEFDVAGASNLEPDRNSEFMPFVESLEDYIACRCKYEALNLKIWEHQKIQYSEIPFLSQANDLIQKMVEVLMQNLSSTRVHT